MALETPPSPCVPLKSFDFPHRLLQRKGRVPLQAKGTLWAAEHPFLHWGRDKNRLMRMCEVYPSASKACSKHVCFSCPCMTPALLWKIDAGTGTCTREEDTTSTAKKLFILANRGATSTKLLRLLLGNMYNEKRKSPYATSQHTSMAAPSGEWELTQRWKEITRLTTYFKRKTTTTMTNNSSGTAPRAYNETTTYIHPKINNTRWSEQRGGLEVKIPLACQRAPRSKAVLAKTLGSSHRGHANTQSECF
ncbi:unnamed protein product [Ectocarpus sp. 12 AP-2014]